MQVPRKLIVISAPSGGGKTSIAKEILRRHPEILFSVSATTRARRNDEMDGKDYFYLTKDEFEKKIRNNELVEWERIYDDYYGTLREQVDKALNARQPMLFDVDVKGALSIKARYPKDAMLIFIEPPSVEELTQRLKGRKTENEEALKKRLERVQMELGMKNKFDVIVVNNDLAAAQNEVDEIILNGA